MRVRNRMSVSAATCQCSRKHCIELLLAKRRMTVKAVVGVRPCQHLLLFLSGRTLERSRTDAVAADADKISSWFLCWGKTV